MAWSEKLHTLRNRSEREKRSVAVFASVAITVVIFAAWGYGLAARIKTEGVSIEKTAASGELSPLGAVASIFTTTAGEMKQGFQALNKGASALLASSVPAAASTTDSE